MRLPWRKKNYEEEDKTQTQETKRTPSVVDSIEAEAESMMTTAAALRQRIEIRRQELGVPAQEST